MDFYGACAELSRRNSLPASVNPVTGKPVTGIPSKPRSRIIAVKSSCPRQHAPAMSVARSSTAMGFARRHQSYVSTSRRWALRRMSPLLDYDGCAEWGGFEEPQMLYLSKGIQRFPGQTRWDTRVVNHQVHDGHYSALVPQGVSDLPPILWASAIPHRFACHLKSDKAVNVKLQVGLIQKSCQVTAEWREFSLDVTPPDPIHTVTAKLTVPAGASVFVDTVSFRPRVSIKPET